MRRPSIDLYIDELVLDGFAPADRHLIGDAVERHLALLLSVRGVPEAFRRNGRLTQLDAGVFHVGGNHTADSIGRQVARSVYGGLIGPGVGKNS